MDRKKGSKCPICGNGILRKEEIKEVFEYKGTRCSVPDYVVFKCPSCKEEIVSKESLKRAQKIIVDFQRKVDGMLTSSEIRQLRIGLGFTQREMSNRFGGGEKSFARYENATLRQSRAMDNLLRFLKRFPFLADSISPENQQLLQNIVITEKVAYDSSSHEEYDIGEFQKASGF